MTRHMSDHAIHCPVCKVKERGELLCAITVYTQAGAIGLSYLLRASYNGRISLLSLLPTTSRQKVRALIKATRGRPAVIVIGDDDGADRGPAGWRTVPYVLGWAARIIIHAAGAEEQHYEWAVVAAEFVGKSLVIECSTATAQHWIDAVERLPEPVPTLVIWPRQGFHPIPPERIQ